MKIVLFPEDWSRRPAEEPVHRWYVERRLQRSGRASWCRWGNMEALSTASSARRIGPAWLAVATAVPVEGARLATQSSAVAKATAVAVAAEASPAALAAEASTVPTKDAATCKHGTSGLSLEETSKRGGRAGRNLPFSYLPFFPVVYCSAESVTDNVLEVKLIKSKTCVIH